MGMVLSELPIAIMFAAGNISVVEFVRVWAPQVNWVLLRLKGENVDQEW